MDKYQVKKLLLQAGFGLLSPKVLARGSLDHPLKKCLWCGSMHRHNNSFCSAGCCRQWQAKRRTDFHAARGE